MSAVKVFTSFKRPATKTEIAKHIAEETIAEHKAERKGREHEPPNDRDMDRLNRLATLMVGPHKDAVIPVVLRAYPQMASLLNLKVGKMTTLVPHIDPEKDCHGEIEDVNGVTYHWEARHVLKNGSRPGIGHTFAFRVSNDGLATDLDQIDRPALLVAEGTA